VEFLDVLDTMRAEEATRARLYAEEGAALSRSRRGAAWDRRVLEAATLIGDVQRGRQPTYRLQEAMTTSDFPLLFGDVIDRVLLSGYAEAPYTWQNWASRRTVPDFRDVKEYDVTGGEGVLSGPIPELTEYPARALTEAYQTYSVAKYGNRMAFSWEALINDDLGALNDVPSRFGRAARRSEERLATTMIADSNGPHATLYSVAHSNLITIALGAALDNPVLGVPGLQAAFGKLAQAVDSDGEPIAIDAVELVVPPALEVTARNLLNATEILSATGGGAGTGADQLRVANWMQNRTRISVNSYLPRINTTSGSTAWYLFAQPAGNRAAVRIAFLRGHESPEIFMKDPNARRVGGGTVNPTDGDFESDAVEYKVRHVLGVAQLDSKLTVASKGTAAA
jgi:hypothetical protein